jgi:formate dehydrogenase gamma subunit
MNQASSSRPVVITDQAVTGADPAVQIASHTEDVMVGDEIVRHRLGVRVNHWLVAVFFIGCLFTGMPIWTPVFGWMANLFGGLHVCRWLHPWLGLAFFASSLVMIAHWGKRMKFERSERGWLGPRMIRYMRYQDHDDNVGKYNGGQKLFFWAASLGAFALIVTGVILWLPTRFQDWARETAILLHDVTFIAFSPWRSCLSTSAPRRSRVPRDDEGARSRSRGRACTIRAGIAVTRGESRRVVRRSALRSKRVRRAEQLDRVDVGSRAVEFVAGLLRAQARAQGVRGTASASGVHGSLRCRLDRVVCPLEIARSRPKRAGCLAGSASRASARRTRTSPTARALRRRVRAHDDYLSRAMLRPWVEVLRQVGVAPDRVHARGRCPYCGARRRWVAGATV